MHSALNGDYYLMRAIRFLGRNLWDEWLTIYHNTEGTT
jgi:hypothetical protein